MMREPRGINIWARLAVLGAMVFFASGFVSVGEIGYTFWGRTTMASVRASRGINANTNSVRYSFQDLDGTRRVERSRVAGGGQVAGDGQVQIEFVPGRAGKSRMVGTRNDVLLGIFVGSMLFSAFMFLGAWHQSHRERRRAVRVPRPANRVPKYISPETWHNGRLMRRIANVGGLKHFGSRAA
jgi:hypothetical protein